MSIKKKKLEFVCYKCDGSGKIKKKNCNICKGTGIWKDEIYYFIDEKNKQAFDGDTIK